jgi:hypothetical protein
MENHMKRAIVWILSIVVFIGIHGSSHLAFSWQKNTDINAKDESGRTALINHTMAGHIKEMKALIEKGVNLNLVDKEGRTALIWASLSINPEAVKILIDAGAQISIVDNSNRSALSYARDLGNIEIQKILLTASGAKPIPKPDSSNNNSQQSTKRTSSFTNEDAETKPISRDAKENKEDLNKNASASKEKDESKDKDKGKTEAKKEPVNTDPLDDSNLSDWVAAQKRLINAYFESQQNAFPPDPYFCGTPIGIAKPDQLPVNMRGLYGWKIIAFEGEGEDIIWKVSVDAPVGRSSTAGLWLIRVHPRPGSSLGDFDFCIYSMSRGGIPSN